MHTKLVGHFQHLSITVAGHVVSCLSCCVRRWDILIVCLLVLHKWVILFVRLSMLNHWVLLFNDHTILHRLIILLIDHTILHVWIIVGSLWDTIVISSGPFWYLLGSYMDDLGIVLPSFRIRFEICFGMVFEIVSNNCGSFLKHCWHPLWDCFGIFSL